MYKLRNKLSLRSLKFILIGVLFLTFFAYIPFLKSFFQQDEWSLFGIFISFGHISFLNLFHFFLIPSGFHYAPLANIFSYVEFYYFGLNFLGYGLFSILGHLVIVFLVYLFSYKLSRNQGISFVSALLFGLSAAGYQATTWIVANVSVQGAVIFALFSLIVFFDFLSSKKDLNKKILLIMIFLFTSLLFKEIAISFFVFLPILFYLFSDKKDKSKYFYLAFIFGMGVIYGLLRFLMAIKTSHISQTAFLGAQSKFPLIYNLLTFPIKGVSQTFIPVDLQLSVSEKLAIILPVSVRGNVGTTAFDLFVQGKIFEILGFLIFLTIIIVVFFVYKKTQKKEIKRVLIFGILFIMFNSLIYAISPERIGIISIIDSRNLYFLTIGSSLLIGILLQHFSKEHREIVFFFALAFLILNIFYLSQSIYGVSKNGVVRSNILNKIKQDIPKLPGKVVVYTESDSSFYGLPPEETIMPFQSGFGQTLLVWYNSVNKFPSYFFDSNFLWKLDSQGYGETNNIGFGYFRNFTDLLIFITGHQELVHSVIAFSYNTKTNEIKNITQEVQGRLDGYFTKKNLISNLDFTVTSSSNNVGIQNMFDNNRESFWTSNLAYATYQYLLVEFNKPTEISQVSIDSGFNKDQNTVGYSIFLSMDKTHWNQVFYSKYDPPNSNGVVNIYFEPTVSKFVKIVQIGSNKYTPWVISELRLYAKN